MTNIVLRRCALLIFAIFTGAGMVACDGTGDRLGAAPGGGVQDPGGQDPGTQDPGTQDPGDSNDDPAPEIQTIAGRMFTLKVGGQQQAAATLDLDQIIAMLRQALVSDAFAQESTVPPGLEPQEIDNITIAIFDPEMDGYVDLGVDLNDGLTLNADGTYEIDVPTVSEAVEAAVLERFPNRSISSFLAEDCVLVLTYTDGNDEEQTLRVPLTRDELDVSPLTEFLARELENGGDFENLTVDSVNEILEQVEGVELTAEGAEDLDEVFRRVEEVAGTQVRERVSAAQEPAADASTRDAALGTYDVVSMDLQFFGEEDPETGGDAFFGRLNVITDIFSLDLAAGDGDNGIVIADGSLTDLKELELGASLSGSSVNYFVNALIEEEDIGQDLANTGGSVRANGVVTFNVPASTFVDDGIGEIANATVIRLQPAGGSGAYTLRAPFRESEYQTDQNGAIDLSRRTARESGLFFGLAFRQSENVTPGGLNGRYGSVSLIVDASNNGDLILEGGRLERNFDTNSGEVTTGGEIRAVERTGGSIDAFTESVDATIMESFTGGQLTRDFVLTDANGDELEGRVLDGGSAYAARLLRVTEGTSGQAERVASDIELGFRLGETAPDISGAQYRLQTVQFELGSALTNGEASSLFETVNGAIITIPEGGLAEGVTLPLNNIVADFVQRDNDAGALTIGSEREDTAALEVAGFDAANSFFELVNAGADPAAGTLPGFISDDGSLIGFALFEALTDSQGNVDGGLTGFAIGTRVE